MSSLQNITKCLRQHQRTGYREITRNVVDSLMQGVGEPGNIDTMPDCAKHFCGFTGSVQTMAPMFLRVYSVHTTTQTQFDYR